MDGKERENAEKVPEIYTNCNPKKRREQTQRTGVDGRTESKWIFKNRVAECEMDSASRV